MQFLEENIALHQIDQHLFQTVDVAAQARSLHEQVKLQANTSLVCLSGILVFNIMQ